MLHVQAKVLHSFCTLGSCFVIQVGKEEQKGRESISPEYLQAAAR